MCVQAYGAQGIGAVGLFGRAEQEVFLGKRLYGISVLKDGLHLEAQCYGVCANLIRLKYHVFHESDT